MKLYNKRKDEKEIRIKLKKKNRKIIKNNKPKLSKDKNDKKFISIYNNEMKKMNVSYIIQRKNNNFNDNILLIFPMKFPIKFRKLFSTLIFFLLIFINLTSILTESNKRNILLESSEITLTINGTGSIKFLSDKFFQLYNPCQIYINNVLQTEIKNEYNFDYQNYTINFVKIIWDININTTKLMFSGCINITEIDLSKFETSNINNMNSMFDGCSSLIFLNLSNISTNEVTTMYNMFCSCSKLTSLDLSNFNTSKVTDIAGIFANCNKLEYINFKLLKLKNDVFADSFHYGCNEKLIICSENEDKKMASLLKQNKSVHCYSNNFTKICKCYSSKTTFDYKFMCDICGKNYIIKENAPNDIDNPYINCYEEIEGYYLDENDWNYKPCYISCKICETNGDIDRNNCTECKEEYKYEINITNSNYKNCYINNPFYTIQSEINTYNYESTIIYKTDNTINIIKSKINIYNYESTIIYKTDNTINIIKSEENTINIHPQVQNKSISNLIYELINDININDLNNGNDKKIIISNKQIIFTSTANQKNNEEENNITMNLGQCENILKDNYNISNNSSLYILQIISEEIGMKIPKIEYEIYYPIKYDNLFEKLNLSFCKGSKIDILISVKIDGPLDIYNSSSDYYNNICYKTTSKSGTDISLNDRRNEFVNNNITLCEENCKLIAYDYIKEKSKCSCDIKTSISSYDDIKFNKNDFFKSFIGIKNIMNINILKCYKTVFQLKELMNNYGFFIVGFLFIFYFLTLIIFISNSYGNYVKEIKNIILALKFDEIPTKKNYIINKPMIKKKNIKINNKANYIIHKKNKIDIIKYNQSKIKNNSKHFLLNSKDNPIKKQDKIKKEKLSKNNLLTKRILKRKEFELNSLNYQEALKIDHRSYCQYYCHLLKYNHPISFSFATYNDYNIRIIKKFLFFFSFSLDLTINALFFTDETIHKIYQDKGKFNFLYQIPQTLYSTLIGKFIDSLIKYLALSQDIITGLKQVKVKKNLERKHKKLLRTLKFKFIYFFLSTFIFIIFFWYYISCFCGIYINSQSHLINDSLISLLTSFFIPLMLNLMPCMFRMAAINVKKPSRKCLYKFSMFLENFFN